MPALHYPFSTPLKTLSPNHPETSTYSHGFSLLPTSTVNQYIICCFYFSSTTATNSLRVNSVYLTTYLFLKSIGPTVISLLGNFTQSALIIVVTSVSAFVWPTPSSVFCILSYPFYPGGNTLFHSFIENCYRNLQRTADNHNPI